MSEVIFIIYKTTNLVNGKFYIGKHRQVGNKFDGYFGSGKLIQEAMRKYGKENFLRETIAVFDNEPECYVAEEKIIGDLWKSRNTCYNLAPGGDCGISSKKQEWWDNNLEKRVQRKESWIKDNPSKTLLGKIRIAQANKNRKWSDESRIKCGLASKGKPKPKTQCPYCSRLIANNMFERYHNNNCKEKT